MFKESSSPAVWIRWHLKCSSWSCFLKDTSNCREIEIDEENVHDKEVKLCIFKKSLYQILLCKLSRVCQRPLLKLRFIEEDETITYKFPQLTLLTLSYFSKASHAVKIGIILLFNQYSETWAMYCLYRKIAWFLIFLAPGFSFPIALYVWRYSQNKAATK